MIELRVDFPHIASYLRNAGWHPTYGGEVAEFWINDEAQVELLVPRSTSAPDFDKRLQILANDLQQIEERPAAQITGDISRQFLDITDIRADHSYGEDCIPLEAGNKLFSTAKGLVVWSTASTLHRRSYYGRSVPKRARDQAKKTLVGHTRAGSYIVPIINNARVPDIDPIADDQPRLIESVEEAAFERRVATTLARALGVLHEIAVVREYSPSSREIHDAVGEGVSFEMCRAVVQSLQDDAIDELDISFAWAPAVAPPARVGNYFAFPAESAEAIKDICVTLKADPGERQEVIYGIVVSLRSRRGEPGGRVEIETLVDNVKRHVRLDLVDIDYEIARASHKHTPVVARGTLHRNPGRMATMDVASFEQDLSLPFEVYDRATTDPR